MNLDMEVQRRRDLKEFIQSQGLCVETDTTPKTLAEASKYPFGVRNCPECQFELDFDGTYSRAAQEECGHIKCRSCVIHSMAKGEYCRQCAHGMRTRPALWVKLLNYRDRTGNEETSHSRNEKEIESPQHSYTPATATYTNRNRKSSPMFNSTNNNYYNNVHKPFVFYPSMQTSKNTSPETETTPRLRVRDPDFSPMLWNPLSVRKIKGPNAIATSFSSTSSYTKASEALGRAPDSVFSGRVNPEMLNTNSFTNLHAISLTRKTPMTPPEPKQIWDAITISNSESGSESDKSEPNFACAECGKSFSSRWILDLHSGTHSAKECEGDNRPYKFRCNKCPSVFQDTIELCRHLALHYSVERPFQCSLCGTVFKSQKNLRHHVRHLHKYDNNLGNYSQIQNYSPTEEPNRRRALKNIMPHKFQQNYQHQLQTVREFFSPQETETTTSSSRTPVIRNTALPLSPAFTSTTPTIKTTTTTTTTTTLSTNNYRRSPYLYHRREMQPSEANSNQLHVSSLVQLQSQSFNNNKETYNNNNNNSNYGDNNRHSSTISTSTSTSFIKTPTQSKPIQNPIMVKPSARATSNSNPIDLSLYSKSQRNSSFESFPNKKIKYTTFTDVETETGSGIKLCNGEPICSQNSHLNSVPKLNHNSNGNSMTFSAFYSNANSIRVKQSNSENGSGIRMDQASHPYPSHQFRNFNSAVKLFGGIKNKSTFENTDEVITLPAQLHPKLSHISDLDMDCDPSPGPRLGPGPDPESNTLKPGTNKKVDAYNNTGTERGRQEPEAVDSDSDVMEIDESFDPQSSSGSDSTPVSNPNPNPKPEMQHEVVVNTELINPDLMECGKRGPYTDSFQGVTVVHEENGTTHIVF